MPTDKMTPLHNSIFTEKYRPQVFDEVIIDKKSLIQNYLKNPDTIPSFLFTSAKPGTGKTTTAKIIAKTLKCDILSLNSSDERGIDTVREKIKSFAESMSSLEGMKRCVFCDEADKMCLDGSVEILIYENNEFKVVPIKDLDGKDMFVVGYDNETEQLRLTAAYGFASGARELFEVELENGIKVIASEDHPFFQSKDMKHVDSICLKDLKEGDEIIVFEESNYKNLTL